MFMLQCTSIAPGESVMGTRAAIEIGMSRGYGLNKQCDYWRQCGANTGD